MERARRGSVCRPVDATPGAGKVHRSGQLRVRRSGVLFLQEGSSFSLVLRAFPRQIRGDGYVDQQHDNFLGDCGALLQPQSDGEHDQPR